MRYQKKKKMKNSNFFDFLYKINIYFTIYILSQGTLRKALAAEGRFAMFGYVYELNKV